MLAEHLLPTILIVEDDRCLAHVLGRVLSRSGYEVAWAANSVDAIRGFDRAPAVALIDLHLPDGDGVALAKRLRERYPDLPMLLITGCPFHLRDRPQDAKYFRQVLQKPLELKELREAISAALSEDDYANNNAACAG